MKLKLLLRIITVIIVAAFIREMVTTQIDIHHIPPKHAAPPSLASPPAPRTAQ